MVGADKPILRLMPDTGVFPLWTRAGGMTPDGAREGLGLNDELVDELQRWGWEEDSPQPAGGWDAWHLRGAELHRRLLAELGSRFEVRYIPD